MVDTTESEQYLAFRAGGREPPPASPHHEEGLTAAHLAHHVAVEEGQPRRDGRPGRGGSPGPGGGPIRRAGGSSMEEPGAASPGRGLRSSAVGADGPSGSATVPYQAFSREPLVFYKRLVNSAKMLKWVVKAGEAFQRQTKAGLKFFLPITLLGQVLGAHQLVTYRMNIELLKLSTEQVRGLDSLRKFETIWPVILYLLNYWVKNQASLMQRSQTHPQRRLFQAQARRLEQNRDSIEFFHETPEFLEDVEHKVRVGGPLSQVALASPDPAFGQQQAHMLDFSSELEFDDRFEAAEYMVDTRAVGSLTEGQPRIDRSLPAEARPNTKV